MATPRSSQAHQKRVQEIADEAADKIAADSPLEEEVVVVVEELPPGESAGTQTRGQSEAADDMLGFVAQGQKFLSESINRWLDLTASPLGASTGVTEPFAEFLDPRRLTEEGFRMAEAILSSQKELALKVVEAMSPAKLA